MLLPAPALTGPYPTMQNGSTPLDYAYSFGETAATELLLTDPRVAAALAAYVLETD